MRPSRIDWAALACLVLAAAAAVLGGVSLGITLVGGNPDSVLSAGVAVLSLSLVAHMAAGGDRR